MSSKLTMKTSDVSQMYCLLGTYFTPCSSASIVNFEQLHAGWVMVEVV